MKAERSAAGALEHPPRGLDMHSLDHPILEPLRASAESLHEAARAFHFVLARPKSLVAGSDLVRMDQGLAVESKASTVHTLRDETVEIAQPVINSVERRNPMCPGRKDDHLERSRNRLPGRVQWQAQIGS